MHDDLRIGALACLLAVPAGCFVGDPTGLVCEVDDHCLSPALRCDAVCVPAAPATVSVGLAHTCAVIDGEARCWGDNRMWQLGYEDPAEPKMPLPFDASCVKTPAQLGALDISGRQGAWISQIVAGGGYAVDRPNHTCAVLSNGDTLCWGIGSEGEQAGWLGREDASDVVSPGGAVDVGISQRIKRLAVGDRYTCAIREDDRLVCWGAGTKHLGIPGNADNIGDSGFELRALAPLQFDGESTVRAIAAGIDHSCAVSTTGTVWCWGSTAFGKLGLGDPGGEHTVDAPQQVGVSGPAVDVQVGRYHSCALLSSNAVECWGANDQYQLGWFAPLPCQALPPDAGPEYDDFQCAVTPVEARVTDDLDLADNAAVQLVAGQNHNCILTRDGEVSCWGSNDSGQLAHPLVGSSGEPRDIPLGSEVRPVRQIASRGDHTCAVSDKGDIHCWGANQYGQLGTGGCSPKSTVPVEASVR